MMPERHGFILHFGEPSATLTYHMPGGAAWCAVSGQQGYACCYGELLSYGANGDTETCLQKALLDWENGHLDALRLNGRFILIFRHYANATWEIVTDRIGSMHAYAVSRSERIIQIGSDLASLDSARQLDWHAIHSLFSLGFFLGERTYYADTRTLLPHSIYKLSDSGQILQHMVYWAWHHTVNAGLTYNDAVAEYDRLLRQAVVRASASGRVILPLSGGLDSRSLAAVIAHGTIAYSYGYTPESPETRIAAQIAEERQLPFYSHTIQPYLFENLTGIVRALHGCQDVTQARQCSVNAWVRERADAVLTGLWGDVWCDQMGLANGLPAGTALTEIVLKKFNKRGRAWLLDNITKPRLQGTNSDAELVREVSLGLASFAQIQDADFRVKAYKTSTWAFRWSNASLRGFAIGASPRIPYYDVDLIDFFCTLPTAYVRDRRIQIDHLKRFAPELAGIEWQAYGVNLYRTRYAGLITLPRRIVDKIRRALSHRQVIQRNWEVQFLGAGEREKLVATLYGLSPDIVQAQAIDSLVEQFYRQPDAANGYTVSMLLTFAAWLRVTGTG